MEKREAVADQLAAVMDEIAEMERREGFEGPKISTDINASRELIERSSIRLTDENGITWSCELPSEWIEDAIVGEIWRACETRSRPGKKKWQYYMKWPKAPEGDYQVIIQAGPLRFEGRGDSLALAAASAYRDALKAGP